MATEMGGIQSTMIQRGLNISEGVPGREELQRLTIEKSVIA
jgi:hypothetical protein